MVYSRRILTFSDSFRPARPRLLVECGVALLCSLVATALAVIALRISPADLGERWSGGGDDQVLHYGVFASAMQVFPFAPNPGLGFPANEDLFCAPLMDPWSAILLWLATPFLPNSVWALNLYYLVGFAAVGFSAYLFFRALRLRRITASAFTLVIALAPFHFEQLQSHPFMANYWPLPLMGILVLMVAGDGTNPLMPWIAAARTRGRRLAWRVAPILTLTLAVAWTQSYFFVFGAIVVGITWAARCVVALLRRREGGIRALGWPTFTASALAVFIGIELTVLSLNFGDRYWKYFDHRLPQESELYGGKLVELLLPAPTSGLAKLARLAELYRGATMVAPGSEPPGSSLVAVLALALTLGVLVIRAFSVAASSGSRFSRFVYDGRTAVLSGAFLVAFFFYTVSGFGAMIAFLSPNIRAWGRLSIVLQLFALGLAALLLERMVNRWWARVSVLVVIAAVAALDQLGGVAKAIPLRPTSDSALQSFVARTAAAVPGGCGIIQLPLKKFPESGAVGRMGDYDEFLPYVYQKDADLRWSYGSVVGTHSGDYWNDVDPALFADRVEGSGACAILVDRFAYTSDDGWRPWVDTVTRADPVVVSADADHRYELFLVP